MVDGLVEWCFSLMKVSDVVIVDLWLGEGGYVFVCDE